MSIILPILIGLHVLVCVLMILVVLMQRPRSEGLGSAFGGGLTDNVFGSQTTNVLAKFTTWMGVAFFSITLLLSILTAKANSGKTAIQKKLMESPVPAASTTPSPATPPAAVIPDAAKPSEAKAPEATPKAALEPATTPVLEAPLAAEKPTKPVETSDLQPLPNASPEASAPASN
jgi:preprotein translocase subunit SecG